METMRGRRLRIRGSVAVYHCVTRTVNKEMLFDSVAKERLRAEIWRIADFSGVEVIAYCVMTNHFHVLVRVPDGKSAQVTNEELMRRYRVLYPRPTKYQPAEAEVLEAILVEGGEEAETIRQSLLVRMHDVSQFMKTLKQRFSIWYNRNYGRIGTLWSERFKSTLIENAYYALRIVAALCRPEPYPGWDRKRSERLPVEHVWPGGRRRFSRKKEHIGSSWQSQWKWKLACYSQRIPSFALL